MRLLTPAEISAGWGVSPRLVYGLVKRRRLAAYRVGLTGRGKILVDEQDWLDFLAACKVDEGLDTDDEDYKYL